MERIGVVERKKSTGFLVAAWLRNCKDPGQAKIMAKQILQNVPKKSVEGWKRCDDFTVIGVKTGNFFSTEIKISV